MVQYKTLLLAVAAIAFFQCVNGFSQEKTIPPKKDLPPVGVTATKPEIDAAGKSTITFTLKIQPGIAINSNEPNGPNAVQEYLIPTTIELLDQHEKVINAEFKFPPATLTGSPMGDHHVYYQEAKVVSTFSIDNEPKEMRLKYHGYRFANHVSNGYS